MPYAKWIVSVTTMITNETQQFQNLLNCLEKFHFYWKQKHKLRSIPYFNLFVSCSLWLVSRLNKRFLLISEKHCIELCSDI